MAQAVKQEGRLTNRKFAEQDQAFIEACAVAGIESTKRQASKWRNRQGRAWKFAKGLIK